MAILAIRKKEIEKRGKQNILFLLICYFNMCNCWYLSQSPSHFMMNNDRSYVRPK